MSTASMAAFLNAWDLGWLDDQPEDDLPCNCIQVDVDRVDETFCQRHGGARL